MTENHDRIIAEYMDANFNQRLHIYLQFPQLRTKFILVDQNDLNMDLPPGFKLGGNSLAVQMSVLFTTTTDYVKRLFRIAAR